MRIVVADDAAPLRAIFARIARSLGHDVVAEATDAEAILRLAAEFAPDAVVLDSRLPPDGALAVLPSLQALVPQTAIFIVAAIGETAFLRAAIAAGATGGIARPFLSDRVAASLGMLRPPGSRK